jgi:hypothetical protein
MRALTLLVNIICWTVLAFVGLFGVLFGFHFFGIGPTLAVAFGLLVILYWRLSRKLAGSWWTRPIREKR